MEDFSCPCQISNAFVLLPYHQKKSIKNVYLSHPVRYHPLNPNIIAVAVGISLYAVQLNDPSSPPRAMSTTHNTRINTLDWSDNGNFLVTASEDQICVWDSNNASRWHVLKAQQTQKVNSCAFIKASPTSSSSTAMTTSSSKTNATTTRLVYGEYEKIWIWTFNGGGYIGSTPVADSRAHPGAAVSALASSLVQLGETPTVMLASASAGRDGNLKLWKLPV